MLISTYFKFCEGLDRIKLLVDLVHYSSPLPSAKFIRSTEVVKRRYSFGQGQDKNKFLDKVFQTCSQHSKLALQRNLSLEKEYLPGFH